MNNQIKFHTRKVCYALSICLSTVFIWMASTGFCEEAPVKNKFAEQAEAIITTQDTTQLEAQLQEWLEKANACDQQSPSAQCQQLFEAIELLQSALNKD